MENLFVRIIAALALPTVVFAGGAWAMSAISGRAYVKEQLHSAAEADQKPLNQRLGYDAAAVSRHWGALDEKSHSIERHFLQLDLIFPFLYGASLATSLLIVWAAIGRPFSAAWLVIPVVITLLADWTENLVQLDQLQRFMDGSALQPGWVQIASVATIFKIVFFAGSSLLVIGLVIFMVVRAL